MTSRHHRHVRLTALVAALSLLAGACSYRTAGGVKGDRSFTATFDDVQHLVVGHTVRLSDVAVGTVTSVELDGYRAEVEFTVEDGRDFPVGTTASISATSLLGENYVRLRLPDQPGQGLLADGDEVETTGADASFEDLTGRLLTLLSAINGNDISAIIDNSAEAIGGRGPELNGLIRTLSEVTDGLVGQSADLAAVIDSLGSAGDTLAAEADVIGDSLDRAAQATSALSRQRDRVVDTVAALTEATRTFDDEVLQPRRAQLDRIISRLEPVTATLAANRDKVVGLVDSLRKANALVPRVVDRDEVLVYGVIDTIVLPLGLGDLDLGGLVPLSGGEAVTALLDPAPAESGAADGSRP